MYTATGNDVSEVLIECFLDCAVTNELNQNKEKVRTGVRKLRDPIQDEIGNVTHECL